MELKRKTLVFLFVLLAIALSGMHAYAAVYGEWTVSSEWTLSTEWTIGGVPVGGAGGSESVFTLIGNFYVAGFRSVILPIVAVPLFSWPDFANLLSGFQTAYYIFPMATVGMVVVALAFLYYRRADAVEYILTSPQLIVLAFVGLIASGVFYIVISTILGAFA